MADPLSVATLGLLHQAQVQQLQFSEVQGLTMRRDFKIIRGTTFRLNSVARKTDGSVINLTGASLVWRVGTDNLAKTEIEITNLDDITVTDAVAGKYELLLTPSKTTDLTPGFYRHQAEVTESGGDISAVLVGQAQLEGDLQ